jgi:hypothetical protein
MFNAENAEAYYWRAVANLHLSEKELAVEDFKKSCDLGNKEACDRYKQYKNQ